MKKIIFTVDVEDWFQPENLKSSIHFNQWDSMEIRVEKSTLKILDLLSKYDSHATFFVLGWIAERKPQLVKEIHQRGHEIASHGYAHQLVYNQSAEDFREDIKKSKVILEDIIGKGIYGYRAPCFSITNWALEIVKQEGFLYDSSICPASLHDRYSKFKIQIHNSNDSLIQIDKNFWELPIPILNIGANKSIPWGGGGYFRFYPYSIFKAGMKKIMQNGQPFAFYTHPSEVDFNQPRVKDIDFKIKFRNYCGLKSNLNKLTRLVTDFKCVSITEHSPYLVKNKG